MDRDCICQKETEELQNNPCFILLYPCSSRQFILPWPQSHVPSRGLSFSCRAPHSGQCCPAAPSPHGPPGRSLCAGWSRRTPPATERQQLSHSRTPTCTTGSGPDHSTASSHILPWEWATGAHQAWAWPSLGKLSLELCLSLPVSPAWRLRPKLKGNTGSGYHTVDNNTPQIP